MPRKKPEAPAKPARKPRARAPREPKVPTLKPAAVNNEHVPDERTRAQVQLAAGFAMPHKMICKLIGLGSDHTLRKHYEHELELGMAMAVFKVSKTLFSQATREKDPSLAAAIFFLKCQAGWREKVPLDDPNVRQSLAELIALSGLTTSGPLDPLDPLAEALRTDVVDVKH